jgi:hypothetical protein
MDHTYIEEHQIADRYVQGTLPEDEAERFENHYLSCPACLDSLDLAESVQRGFRRTATQDAERLTDARQLVLLAWLGRLSRQRQAGILLSALLVLTVLSSAPGLYMSAERGRELRQTQTALAAERQRTATAGTLRADLDAGRRALAGERAAHARDVTELDQLRQPEANVAVLLLDLVRDAGPSPEAPAQQVRQPAASGRIVLASPVDRPFQPSYRAELLDGHGREVCRWRDLQPDDHDLLGMSLLSNLVSPGDYSLVVEGVTTSGKPAAAGRFTFRVLK